MNDIVNIENTLIKCMLRLDSEGLHMDEITKITRSKYGINVRKNPYKNRQITLDIKL